MRSLLVALVAVTALTACKKESAAPAEPETSSDQSGSGDEQAAAEAPALEPLAEEEQPVEITPALVDKYVAFQRLSVQAHEEEIKKFAAASKSAEGKGTVDALKLMTASANLTETLAKRDQAARKSVGLTEPEFNAVSRVVGDTVLIHQMVLKTSPELEKSLAEMKKSLAEAKDATPEQKAEAQQMISQTEQGMKNQLELKDARAEHGDPAVEAVLARESEIYELQQKAMGLLSHLR